jgi:hypothetical protein
MSPTSPVICLVDDQPDKAEATLRGSVGSEVVIRARHPSELDYPDLEDADIILVDFELRTRWSRSGGGVLARHPPDGLALAGVIRSHISTFERARPQAIGLYSAELRKVSQQLPAEVRGYAFARLHDLEWVFEKMDDDAGRKILGLGLAVQRLARTWPENAPEAEQELHNLLALPEDVDWSERAADEIEDCHPPIHELSELSHTLALLRWFAQRVLPYPCFLADRFYAAARLRLAPHTFDELVASKTSFGRDLDQVRYRGMLDDFLGVRWWRAGLDTCLWQWTDGSLSARDLASILAKEGVRDPTTTIEPVVVIDEHYQAHSIANVEQALRVQPDDWPSFAEPAWALIEDVIASPRLRGLVIRDHRARLAAEEEKRP